MRGTIIIILIIAAIIGYNKRAYLINKKNEVTNWTKRTLSEYNFFVIDSTGNKTQLISKAEIIKQDTISFKPVSKPYKVFENKVTLRKKQVTQNRLVKNKFKPVKMPVLKTNNELSESDRVFIMLNTQKMIYQVKTLKLKEPKYKTLSINSFSANKYGQFD